MSPVDSAVAVELPPLKSSSVTKRMVVAIEERLLVPCYASPRRSAWTTLHGALAVPLTAFGRERRVVARTGDETITVAAVGNAYRAVKLLRSWFDEVSVPRGTGSSRPLWSPISLSRMPEPLRVVEIHRWLVPRFRAAGWQVVPDSVRWLGDLTSIPPRPLSSSLKSDLANVRNGGFGLEHAGSAADWNHFFLEMVRPNALARFGDDAWILSARLMRALRRAGHLLFVHASGDRVGGVCMIRTGESAWMAAIGVRHREDGPTPKGVGAAIYALTIEWARSAGVRRLDLGRTSPFVNDSIASYKRKWGFRPVADPLSHRLALSAEGGCHVWNRAIARNPVLIEDAAGLARFAG